jgi:hypothetical protein
MISHTPVRRAGVFVVLMLFLFTGCLSSQKHGLPHAIGEELAANAVNYNLAIENSQNQMLLLNVIRAMNHRPLYLTDTSKVTGTVNGTFSLGLQLPFSRGADDLPDLHASTVSPTITYSTSPSMDVNLLASQDFMQGFLKPIPPELFAYYWDQGWSDEFLLYMLVLTVDEYKPTGDGKYKHFPMDSFHNHPMVDNKGDLAQFASWVHAVVADGRPTIAGGQPFQQTLPLLNLMMTEAQTTTETTIPKKGDQVEPIKQTTVQPGATSATDLLAALDSIAKDQSFSLAPFPGSIDQVPGYPPDTATGDPLAVWTISAPGTTFTLTYQHVSLSDTASQKPKEVEHGPDQATAQTPARLLTFPQIAQRAALHKNILAIPSDGPPTFHNEQSGSVYVLSLRSPEGVLYYLGELARTTNERARAQKETAVNDDTAAYTVLIHAWDLKASDHGDPTNCDDPATDPVVPLFVAIPRTSASKGTTAVVVRTLERNEFEIPGAHEPIACNNTRRKRDLFFTTKEHGQTEGHSMHALSLVSQLVALQKIAKDFPTTSTVKVVGQ